MTMRLLQSSGTCSPLTDTARIGSDRCYTVKVEVRDGLTDDRVEVKEDNPDDSITVKIGVRDRDEPPAVPTVTVTSPEWQYDPGRGLGRQEHGSRQSPSMTCSTARAAVPSQTITAAPQADNNCTRLDDDFTGDNATTITTTTIVDLEEDTSYSVQVRAKNEEGTSAWSRVVTVKY